MGIIPLVPEGGVGPLFDRKLLPDVFVSILEATIEPDRWNDVCDQVEAMSGATAFLIFAYDLTANNALRFYGSRIARQEGAPLVEALKAGNTEEDNRAYRRLMHFDPMVLVPEYRLLDVRHDRDMPPNANRDAVLTVAGSKSRSLSRLNEIGPWMDTVALHMPCFGADIPADVQESLEFLMPVMRKALETSTIIRSLTRQYGMLLSVFDSLEFAAAFCGSDGRVLVRNDRMRELLEERDALSLSRSGIIEPIAIGKQADFHRAMQAAMRSDSRPEALWLSLPRRSGRSPMVAKASPVRGESLGKPHDPLVLLLVADPDDDSRLHAEGLAALGILTSAEMEVCRLLVRGTATASIAEARATTVATARQQINAVTTKLGCRSRLDLLRIALATSVPQSEQSTDDRRAQ